MLRRSSFFQYDNSVVTEFPLSQQYFVHSSNIYVATSIIMPQHSFSAASASWCRDPSFNVATASLFRLCCNVVLYYLHFYRSSFFQYDNSVATDFPLSQQYFVHSSNSYVATSIIMPQHSFNAASASWCRNPSFNVVTASLFRLCSNVVLYYLHFYSDLESLSR